MPLYRIETIIQKLMGKVIAVEMKVVSSNRGDFHREMASLASTKPLVRFVTLAPERCAPM
jgi:hypothetical protein